MPEDGQSVHGVESGMLAAHPFRMPLESDDGPGVVYHGLQNPVRGPLNGGKALCRVDDGLMMGTVDGELCGTVKLRQEATRGTVAPVSLILLHPLVGFKLRNVLAHFAPKVDVDELVAFTDPKDRLSCPVEYFCNLQLADIPIPLNFPAAPVFFSEQLRVNISPTGENQSVIFGEICFLQHGGAFCPQQMEGVNKVLGTLVGACNGDVHGSPSFLLIMLLYRLFSKIQVLDFCVLLPYTIGNFNVEKSDLCMKVVDMHCDTIGELWKAEKAGKTMELRENGLHIDLEKMKQGDYLLQNFAMFVFLGREKDPLVNVLEMIDVYRRQMAKNQDIIAPVLRYEDIEKNTAAGKMSGMLTIEEGGVLKGSPYVLRNLYELGVRMLTLTWNFENEIGYPNTIVKREDYDPNQRYGLKEAGIEIVREMNNLGMIVDVSHLGDDGFWDVVKYSKAPFVASHSNARSLCGHTRNLTDDMIRALADKGGVTGINFCGDFLNENGKSRVEDMVRHMKHIKNVGGIGVLGLGTDYDGIDGDLELNNCSTMQRLAEEMEKQGFTHKEVEQVFHENVLNLYKEVLK